MKGFPSKEASFLLHSPVALMLIAFFIFCLFIVFPRCLYALLPRCLFSPLPFFVALSKNIL